MSGECCNCREHCLDCDCEDMNEWYCIDDIQPNPGQICDIKCVVIMRACYSPDDEASDWEKCDDNLYEKAEVIAWRSL